MTAPAGPRARTARRLTAFAHAVDEARRQKSLEPGGGRRGSGDFDNAPASHDHGGAVPTGRVASMTIRSSTGQERRLTTSTLRMAQRRG